MSSAVYRVEIAKGGQAGCQGTQCKKDGTKIAKGELRQGVQVTIQEHTSWKWRHWGCVTPTVLHNWAESSEMDMELVDGYDILPPDVQEKVKRALEEGHVDDDEWNGDMECNRFNSANKNQGMFVKTPKKKAKDYPDDSEDSPAKKKASKKRSRVKDEDDEADKQAVKPPPKKAKGRGKKAAAETADSDGEPTAPAKKTRAPRKTKAADNGPSSDTAALDDEPPPPAKKSKAKKAAPKIEAVEEEEEDVDTKPKKRRGRPKKAVTEED